MNQQLKKIIPECKQVANNVNQNVNNEASELVAQLNDCITIFSLKFKQYNDSKVIPDELKITRFSCINYNRPVIEMVADNKYAIRFMGGRFTKKGKWIEEPILASSRSNFFKNRTQMTLDEAFKNYQKSIDALEIK